MFNGEIISGVGICYNVSVVNLKIELCKPHCSAMNTFGSVSIDSLFTSQWRTQQRDLFLGNRTNLLFFSILFLPLHAVVLLRFTPDSCSSVVFTIRVGSISCLLYGNEYMYQKDNCLFLELEAKQLLARLNDLKACAIFFSEFLLSCSTPDHMPSTWLKIDILIMCVEK